MKMGLASLGLAAAMVAIAPPAGADVKSGVDAWARGDWSRAVAEWRPLAIAGDADAQFNLGQAYKLGRGVPIDNEQALAWFKRAADQGHVQAQDNYGIGLFQANRKAEALPWLERSAARGESRAELVLGTMLFNGDGVRADYPRAYALMTRASQAGLPSASQSLAQMDGFITPADRERGLQLAQAMASAPPPATVNGRTAVEPATRRGPVPVSVPPSRDAVPPRSTPPRIAPAHPTAARPAPARPVPVAARPAPHPAPARAPAPAAAVGGSWRVQLGAFRDRGNAEQLWNRVRARVGGSPAYVAGGGVTRLQATGFASRGAAQAACAKAGVACVVVAP